MFIAYEKDMPCSECKEIKTTFGDTRINRELEIEILLGTLKDQPHWCPNPEEESCSALGACAALDLAVIGNCKHLFNSIYAIVKWL